MLGLIKPASRDQVIAMAGLLQAATLVQQLARRDNHDITALSESVASLFTTDAESTEAVFGSIQCVDLGMRTIVRNFSSKPDESAREVYQYAALVHQMALKLTRLSRTAEVIHNDLAEIAAKHLDDEGEVHDHDALYEDVSDLYTRTISFVSPRIIVQGDPGKLKQPETVARVRSALFSGIRAAMLWHQSGGRRWHLLFNRNSYVNGARYCLDH